MKVYVAIIYCPYEGTNYARGIFSTREKAEQAVTWFTENKEYFREGHHKCFGITEYEIDSSWEFDEHLQQTLQYMKYIAADKSDYEEDRKQETIKVLEKLGPLHKEKE